MSCFPDGFDPQLRAFLHNLVKERRFVLRAGRLDMLSCDVLGRVLAWDVRPMRPQMFFEWLERADELWVLGDSILQGWKNTRLPENGRVDDFVGDRIRCSWDLTLYSVGDRINARPWTAGDNECAQWSDVIATDS